eukprot:CAMPEP_0201569812 /NCGR_PEP_ID=MMETSP0190_2-20130828/11723_1 /ASSEMBLY_ACC=CAM_ASM_000263 /TAXON_ID=37353 /ORGANISM="Rosalina sp." /LENGTH=277 /DNA_ID=CAMNT_0047992597 /DNA_START=8 /DNA_END=841 /DNA_ORIENTATION=-
MADSKEDESYKQTEVYILSITVKKATGLPDLDKSISSKDVTDPVCQVTFADPSTKNKYNWRTSEIRDNLNPVWNETNSWPLLFNPPDNLPITFEIWDVDSFTSSDEVGKVTIELGKIEAGKAYALKAADKKPYKKGINPKIIVEACKKKLILVPENFVKNVNERLKVDENQDVQYATVDELNKKLETYSQTKTVNQLQSTIQKLQQANITNASKYASKVDVEKDYVKKEEYVLLEQKLEAMEKAFEAKLKELSDGLNNKVGGISDKLGRIKEVLSDD